jgi:hypothetical protein
MRKLMLVALAPVLAMAAVSEQARAAIQTTGSRNDLLSMVDSRGDGVSNADDTGMTASYLLPEGVDDFTLGRRNVAGADLKRHSLNQKSVVGALQGEFVPAKAGSGQLKVVQSLADEGSKAAEIKLAAGANLVPERGVGFPEPGRWATVLAGLLGVIAIARRRMSL